MRREGDGGDDGDATTVEGTEITIWASAFIAPTYINFPSINPFDLNAVWHGDNRTFYENLNQTQPPARAWWMITFNTADPTSVQFNQDTGQTIVWDTRQPTWLLDYINNNLLDGILPSQATIGKAPPPIPPTVTFSEQEVNVIIEGHLSNPLILSPAIDIYHNITISEDGIQLNSSLDNYPWHELFITADNGANQGYILLQQRPIGEGIFNSPIRLFFQGSSYNIFYEDYGNIIKGFYNH